MSSRVKTLALLSVVAGAALIPLYGDPRLAPVTHSEWARMMLRGLDLLEATETLGDQSSQFFQALSWKNSLVYTADRYARGEGVSVFREGAARRVRATGEIGEAAYPFAVVRGGNYRLRAMLGGSPDAPAEAEVAKAGERKPVQAFRLLLRPESMWVDGGSIHLDPGAYTVTLLLPRDTLVDYVELAPPCLGPIEPFGGWRSTAVASTEDVAVTMLQALDAEHELPAAATPVERAGADFQIDGQPLAVPVGLGPEALEIRAGAQGLRAVGLVDLPEKGVYTVSVFGDTGGGQTWLADSCRKAILCPTPERLGGPRWTPVLTGEFAAGRHYFGAVLSNGATVGRVRLEKKKVTGDDYVAALRRLGFDAGPPGPITREKALEAMNFLTRRRTLDVIEHCGEIVLPGAQTPPTVLVAQAAPPPGAGGPGPPPARGPDTVDSTIGTPNIPPPVVVSPIQP